MLLAGLPLLLHRASSSGSSMHIRVSRSRPPCLVPAIRPTLLKHMASCHLKPPPWLGMILDLQGALLIHSMHLVASVRFSSSRHSQSMILHLVAVSPTLALPRTLTVCLKSSSQFVFVFKQLCMWTTPVARLYCPHQHSFAVTAGSVHCNSLHRCNS